jgi:hypothetical protein
MGWRERRPMCDGPSPLLQAFNGRFASDYRRRNHLLTSRVTASVRPGAAKQENRFPRTMLVAMGLCLSWLSTIDAKAQSLVLDCSIGGQERSEMIVVDPSSKSITIGKTTMHAEVTPQRITWKENGTVRVIDRSTGAVLHRLPDESYFHIGQCRSSKRKF